MNMRKFERDMSVFSFKQHQEVLTYLKHLESKGWTIETVFEWIAIKKRELDEDIERVEKERLEYEKKLLKCPLCGTLMYIRPVNVDLGTQTGDPADKSVWMCPNEKCLHTIYNKKTAEELLR